MNALRRVSFYTLGCRLNQAETALMAESFRTRGYVVAEHGAPVDVAVINTCSVTDHADQRCRQEIRKVRRYAPQAIVCAVGCYAQADTAVVAAIMGVDLVVGTDRKYALAELVEARVVGPSGIEMPTAVSPPPPRDRRGLAPDDVSVVQALPVGHGVPDIHVSVRPDTGDFDYPMAGYYPHSTRAHVKIQDGCDFCCAFCLLPRVRGAARSRPMEDIIADATELAHRGHKEIVITGVNIGTYRHNGETVADVARRISAIPHVARVRVSSIEPSTVGDDLLEWMATSPKACRHLHLPLQSGDDGILRKMKRVYTSGEYARFIQRAKAMMPDLGLGTDVIVGFPGESETEFARTMRFIEEMPFSYLHVFSYSERQKTAAVRYNGKSNASAIKDRSERMHTLAEHKKYTFFADHVGREVDVLFETVDDDGWRKGFTGSYLRVGIRPDAAGENEIASVRIHDTTAAFCLAAA